MHNITQDYILGDELGAGAFGKVVIARELKTNAVRAIKEIQKRRVRDSSAFRNEVEILRVLDHPNIVKIIDTYESPRQCYVVLEYCEGGTLFQRILESKRLSEHEAAAHMWQLFSAVCYCHNNNICHRDLKPENILMNSEDSLKIIDFGLSQVLNAEELMSSLSGTPYYAAPEMLDQCYDRKVDCWSAGVIMYTMLSGKVPFEGGNTHEVLMNVQNSSFSFAHRAFKHISDSAKDLIAQLLVKDPQLRLSAAGALAHP